MQGLEISCAVRLIYTSLGAKGLINLFCLTEVNTSRLCTRMPSGEHRLVGNTLQPPNTSAVDAKDAAILRSWEPISAVSGVWEPNS